MLLHISSNSYVLRLLFSRHRCPHGPTTDETTTIFDEVTNVETISAYRKDFIDNKVTNYDVIRTPAKKPVDNLRPEGDIDFAEKVPYKPAERVIATKPQDNLFVSGEFESNFQQILINDLHQKSNFFSPFL